MKSVGLGLLIGLMVGASGCSSLAYDDREFTQIWNEYNVNRADFLNRLPAIVESSDDSRVLAMIKEQGRYTSDTYYKVIDLQVSPDLEKAQYYFAYHLQTQVSCYNHGGSYVRGMIDGDESYLKYEELYREFMHTSCSAADDHLKKAYEYMQKR